jgi:hypothetical protein
MRRYISLMCIKSEKFATYPKSCTSDESNLADRVGDCTATLIPLVELIRGDLFAPESVPW